MNAKERNRLINAVVYFAQRTRFCGKIKLFKLLYLLDFEHFRETGRSVTGSEYSAWRFGPVPESLYEEWDDPEPDFSRAVHIELERVLDYVRQTVVPNGDFDATHFTPRQLRIMEGIAARYRDTQAPEMIDVVHAENGAWARVWNDGAGRNKRIPYELALPEGDEFRRVALQRSEEARQRAAAERRLVLG